MTCDACQTLETVQHTHATDQQDQHGDAFRAVAGERWRIYQHQPTP